MHILQKYASVAGSPAARACPGEARDDEGPRLFRFRLCGFLFSLCYGPVIALLFFTAFPVFGLLFTVSPCIFPVVYRAGYVDRVLKDEFGRCA
jgi:hypothetical protein